MMRTQSAVTKAAGIMMAAIFLSRIIGLVRESVITGYFGQGTSTDVYFAAFNLPDLLFYLIAGGVLSSAFIPVFVEHITNGRREEAWRIFNIVLTVMTIVIGALIIIGFIFAHRLVPIVAAPGFTEEQLERVTVISRIVLPAQLFFFLGGLFMGAQWAHQRFLMPGLGPSIYNIGIIIGGAITGAMIGPDAVEGLAWGGLGGAFVGNFLLQGLMIRRLGGNFKLSLNLRHPGAVQVWKLMIPVIFSLSLAHVDIIINRWFASYLFDGAVSSLTRADRLMQVPIGIFGQAVGIGFFPTLSALAASGAMKDFRQTVNYGLRILMFVSIPAMVLLIVLGKPVIQALFQHGLFVAQDTNDVYVALVAYSLGIYFWCAQAIVARAFFSMQDTLTPVLVGTMATVIFVPLNWILMVLFGNIDPRLAHAGLALATTISAGLHVGILAILLRKRVDGLGTKQLLVTAGKVCLASILMGGAAWVGAFLLSPMILVATVGVKVTAITQLVIGGGLGAAIFLLTIRLLKMEESTAAWNMVKRRLGRGRPASDEERS